MWIKDRSQGGLRGTRITYITVAAQDLRVAVWAFLYVTARSVQLTLDGGTVMALEIIGMPIECFVSIPDPRQQTATDRIERPLLCSSKFGHSFRRRLHLNTILHAKRPVPSVYVAVYEVGTVEGTAGSNEQC